MSVTLRTWASQNYRTKLNIFEIRKSFFFFLSFK